MQRYFCEKDFSHMRCLRGRTVPQSGIIKPGDFPLSVKGCLCAVLCEGIIHVAGLDFCGKLPGGSVSVFVCVSAGQPARLLTPRFATPFICVSGVDVPQE